MSGRGLGDEGGEVGGVEVAPGVRVAAGELRWAFSRSSGPGGQNVNKVSTKAELRVALERLPVSERVRGRLRTLGGWRVVGTYEVVDELGRREVRGGELVLTCETERSQAGNKAACLEKLRAMLVRAMAEPKVRRKTRPTRGSKERRMEEKKRRGEVKRGRRGGE